MRGHSAVRSKLKIVRWGVTRSPGATGYHPIEKLQQNADSEIYKAAP